MAVVLREAEAEEFAGAMLAAQFPRMSAANWLETAIVVDSNRDPVLRERFDELNHTLRLQIVPVTAEIAEVARLAYQRFGRGHHPARLNYGDCFAYATAKVLGAPLLFKGRDFSQTDVEPARPAPKD